MKKPETYTGIRVHALRAMQTFRDTSPSLREKARGSIIEKLWRVKDDAEIDDLDIASECADYLLAGIDTTSDTLMFLVWCLSLPQNAHIQARLLEECRSLPSIAFKDGAIDLEVADRLPYLNAVIKETLRLFAPLPTSKPRSSPVDTVIDGYAIPRGTVCSKDPYLLHRNNHVFLEPLRWNPERRLTQSDVAAGADMKKRFWPFSSGARMCIGMQ